MSRFFFAVAFGVLYALLHWGMSEVLGGGDPCYASAGIAAAVGWWFGADVR